MKKLTVRYCLLSVTLCLGFYNNSPGQEIAWNKATEAFESNDFKTALLQYQWIKFRHKDDDSLYTIASFHAANCYNQLDMPPKALSELSHVYTEFLPQETYTSYMTLYTTMLYQNGQYNDILFKLQQIKDSTLLTQLFYLKLLCFAKTHQFDQLKKNYSLYRKHHDISDSLDKAYHDLITHQPLDPAKSLYLIPGYGNFKAKKHKKAIGNLLLIPAASFYAYASIHGGLYITGIITGGSLTTRSLLGNYYSGRHAVQQRNKNALRQHINTFITSMLKNELNNQ